ncbi:MAG: FimB/Mfa2 family fimbrial subunit [Tannerellaceae bacterium]|jgi:hypothetical protein|nr:FimB/Mfa2 family fimbrial subunit [Tannerellaceae bacterium]
MKMHNLKLYFLVLILLMSFSCSFEEREIPVPQPPADEFVDALIHIASPSPSTYALTDPEGEKMIQEVDVLVFKESGSNEYYDYRTRTTATTPQQTVFKVSVKKSKNNERYRFAVIANASGAVSNANFTTHATKQQVYALIMSDLSGSDRWDATETSPGIPNKPIPMWGETSTLEEVTDNLQLQPVHMLRALSRIDVVVLPAVQSKFRLTDVYVYNSNRKGRVIPDMANLQGDNVTGVSIPADNNLKVKGPIQYTSSSVTEYKREIYLYEAGAVNENEELQATCLVIGGYYDVPSVATDKSYYRVDFFDSNNQSFKPILRNHCYTIKIANVLDEGYETPEEAFVKREINMTVEIESWVLGESPYNGTPYNFVINRNLFENIGAGLFSGSFVLITEEPGGWTSTASAGVTLTPSSGTTTVATGQIVNFEVAGTAQEPLFINITSGPITKKINITR